MLGERDKLISQAAHRNKETEHFFLHRIAFVKTKKEKKKNEYREVMLFIKLGSKI